VDLCIATYEAPPELLMPRLPRGLELDTLEGAAFVSLVAFDFRDTRVLGIGWPGFRNFPELNLRFYVRSGDGKRGVVFVREYVPLRTVALIARSLYNEPYEYARMTSATRRGADDIEVSHEITAGGRTHSVRLRGGATASTPPEGSTEHFFKEHQWGFGRNPRGNPLYYEVHHPVWPVHPVLEHHIDVDWGLLYGQEWTVLQDAVPKSLILAAGSAVEVYPHALRTLRNV
jgi:uncharacterized protein YqjF (DUF2071 family)